MKAFEFTAPRHDYAFGNGWSRRVRLANGAEYIVGVEPGKRVRIPYKPRGPGAYGYQWHGFVRETSGRTVWGDRVGGSAGARGLLRCAGLIT